MPRSVIRITPNDYKCYAAIKKVADQLMKEAKVDPDTCKEIVIVPKTVTFEIFKLTMHGKRRLTNTGQGATRMQSMPRDNTDLVESWPPK